MAVEPGERGIEDDHQSTADWMTDYERKPKQQTSHTSSHKTLQLKDSMNKQ